MANGVLKPRWGQPLTGIVSLFSFTVLAWILWHLFSDPRGQQAGWFPYPFVMYLAMMILARLWQHMQLGGWPFQNLTQPLRGIIQTLVNLVLVWFIIDIFFYRLPGTGFNFLSCYGLEAANAAGKLPKVAETGATGLSAQVAAVGFVLIGFFTYPVFTIFFANGRSCPLISNSPTRAWRRSAGPPWPPCSATLFDSNFCP